MSQLSSSPKFSTLVDLLRHRAQEQPDQLGYQFLEDGKTEAARYTYQQLDQQARAIAARLQQANTTGERALLLYPQGVEVVAAFCGCLYAGVIAIPVPPPDAGRMKRALPRLLEIVKDADATLVLSNQRIIDLLKTNEDVVASQFEQMTWLNTEAVDLALADQWQNPQVDQNALAYLQYTSGSTSVPKGVMLSHYNLMHHSDYLQRACGYTPDGATVTWMPYFHDYGLVEGVIQPLYTGVPCYVMSPLAFVKRPQRWLEAISKYRATHSQAPNFAYDQCVRRVKPAKREGLDLSCWRAAGNAAEPINPRVMREFAEAYAPHGFRWTTFAPAYGLAEATLLVSSKAVGTEPVITSLDAAELERGRVTPALEDVLQRDLVSCGQLVCETEVVIANPDTLARCAAHGVGEVWVADPGVAAGYWQRSEATEETFQARLKDEPQAGPYMRTGDLGFMQAGELYITGRIKDLIIIRGTNHYPQDIEWTVQHLHPALRPDYGAAFSIIDEGEEKLVVVQEVERSHQLTLAADEILADIRQGISEGHELQVSAIALVKSGNVLKTSSGKIQRRACRQNFLAGKLEIIAEWSERPQLSGSMGDFKTDLDTPERPVQVASY
ncbi:fatty acyl-AMP ligase [Leptothoe sp. PORK10 BA2]|uniref:fatty acyl-AMP ligase n=1 Tax=Leptothoe sp. PORK10 BA2 TaxID=3110254 RepID=UPI002B208EE2|nr:fatty acyl-AMP ligase [Leptothoe sp. PORK10 BA2]MEA5462314.1 fatty acyl-AMP ligase [Leptothoe sp. PORK10 BA2]